VFKAHESRVKLWKFCQFSADRVKRQIILRDESKWKVLTHETFHF
jgi:hypothetical protein